MKRALLALVALLWLVVAANGCAGGAAWRLSTTTPAAGLDWTHGYGAALGLASDGGASFVVAEKGLYALAPDGGKRWAIELPAAHRAVTAADGKLIVTGDDGRVACYGEADGVESWSQTFAGAALSPAAIGGGKVLFEAGNLLQALDAATGQPAWKQAIAVDSAAMRALKFSHVAPAVTGGRVCAGLAWELNVIDLASGEKVAHGDASGGGVSASLVAGDKVCFLPQSRAGGDGTNTVYAIDPTAARFAILWSRDLGGDAADLGISNLALDGDHLYAVTNQRVVALDRATGKLAWEVTGRPVAPVSTARGTRAAAHAFIEGLPPVTTFNAAPGTNFALGDGKLFVAASYSDDKGARDVVTVLDALTGAYLGSYDAGGATVRDVQVTQDHSLVIACSDGVRAVKTSTFAAPTKP